MKCGEDNMEKHIIDEQGKWLIQGSARLLIEPSESYLAQRELERQQQVEKDLIDSLKPNEKEVLMAEIELSTIMLLLEMEVI